MMLAATPDAPVARRLGTLLAGLLLVGSGVAMMIRGELGVAPFDVLATGLAHVASIEIGIAAMLLPLAFTLLGWALGHRPGPGTVTARTGMELTCVAIGWSIGGQVGVGTVVVAVLLGPLLRRMLTIAGFDASRAEQAAECASAGA